MRTPRLLSLIAVVMVVAASFAVAQQAATDPQQPLDKLLQEREETLGRIVEMTRSMYKQNGTSLGDLNAAEARLLEARLDAATTARKRIAILESQLQLAEDRKEMIAVNVNHAVAPRKDLLEANLAVLEIQIALLREGLR